MDNDTFSLLRNKEIIAILDGDTKYGDYEFEDYTTIKIAMPYLSGADLCALSTLFGLPVTYSWNGGALSRWQYLDNLLEHCIKDNKCSSLLAHMFSLNQFSKILNGHAADEIKKAHKTIVDKIIEQINGLLFFGGNELKIIGNTFVVRPIGSKVEIAAPKIKTIDREYIKSISSRAMRDIEQNDFDSAITKSRTLLEETFCYVIEKKNEVPSDSGDIGKLYKQVKTLYNMHNDANTDRRINTLLSGLNSIVSAIAEMRNKDRNKKTFNRLSDYTRAARTIYLNKACFNGLYRVNSKNEFNVPFGKKDKVNTYDGNNLITVSNYLSMNDIKVLCEDFETSLESAKEGDFVYIDPPYDSDTHTFNSYTDTGFDKEEQKRLASVFKKLDNKGVKVMLSNHNTSLINELYKGFNIHVIDAKRSINANGNKRGKVEEVIITNY